MLRGSFFLDFAKNPLNMTFKPICFLVSRFLAVEGKDLTKTRIVILIVFYLLSKNRERKKERKFAEIISLLGKSAQTWSYPGPSRIYLSRETCFLYLIPPHLAGCSKNVRTVLQILRLKTLQLITLTNIKFANQLIKSH